VHLFESIWGSPDAPKQEKKNYFLVVLDHFFYKNGPIYSVRGLFLSLNIRTYIPPTFGLLGTFLGAFGGAQMPQNSTRNLFFGWSGTLILQERA
jgi:hypothetical protein